MEEQRGVSSGASSGLASDSKILGEKRKGIGLDEKDELGSKRLKVLDPDSDGKASCNLQSDKGIGIVEKPNLRSEEVPEMVVAPVVEGLGSVVRDGEGLGKDIRPGTVVESKVNSVSTGNDRGVVLANTGKEGLVNNHIIKEEKNCESQGGEFDVVLKNSSLVKPREVSETVVTPRGVADPNLVQRDPSVSVPSCEKVGPDQMCSAAGSIGESDSMRRWMEMKKNGFLSGPLGGVTAPSSAVATTPVEVPAPKQQKNKRKGDSLKKRNEVPRREQQLVDRFSNVTAPSGLLTELNPGIISHIRTKKQVCSIIAALIRNATYDATTGKRHVDLNVRESVKEEMALTFKLPSTEVSDNANSITNPEQATALAVEAATVASQWLEFLHQDLSGRLSAVQDSRSRVQNILTTELPLLASSRDSSANQDDTLQATNTNTSGDASSDKTVTETHQLRWSAKFDQLNKSLYDEERDLERSLNQVKEMQSRCNEGLRQMDVSSPFSSQSSDSSFGREGNQENSVAVQAAAASIFSTCSFLLSMMKPPPTGS